MGLFLDALSSAAALCCVRVGKLEAEVVVEIREDIELFELS
jgi:hypothetical protein